MMSKERQRAELHKTIWRIANDLRGSVDGWDFKSYVLGMLFYRFISENLVAYLNEQERQAGNPDFDYAKLSDTEAEQGRAETVKEKGLLHPAQRAVRERQDPGKHQRPFQGESQRGARDRLPAHRGLGRRHR
jgi:type I restriction enzyme M protein